MPDAPQDEGGEVAEALRSGDPALIGALIEGHAPRLRRMVALRIDPRLAARLDPSDVIQEAYVDITARLADYARDPRMPFFLWLRFLVGQKLAQLHRSHLGTVARDAGREVRGAGDVPDASTISMASLLVDPAASPSQDALREERRDRVRLALDALKPGDREVLALRHFELLGNDEVALVLGLSRTAASQRYVRALARLQEALSGALGPSPSEDGPR